MHEIATVTLNAGIELEVNPALVVAIHPNEEKPKVGTIIHVLGTRFKVRGHHLAVKAALGWKTTNRLGFDAPESPEPEASPGKQKPATPGTVPNPPMTAAEADALIGEPSATID